MTELSSDWSNGHNCPQTTPNIISVPTVRDIWGLTSSQSDLQEPVWFGNGHWIKVSRIAPIHSKSEKIGGVYLSGQQNWRKKCVNSDNIFLRQLYVNHENASNIVVK